MGSESRTGKAVRNVMVTMACQILYLIVSFGCRTVFTVLLGKTYLGINGLFTNVLTILSFAELGIGSAMVYRMYAPLAEGDLNKVALFLQLYRKVYHVIIAVICTLGVILIPFLKYLVKAPDVKENVILLYCLYLFDTVISYVYVYKKSLLIADQNNYIVSVFAQIFNVIMNILQIIALLITHNFVVYCLIKSGCNLANNIACSRYVDKRYSFLKDPVQGEVSKEEINGLKTDVKGLLLNKLANVTFCGTDNFFISAYLSIDYVGILSNYTMLLTTVNAIMNKVFDSVTASIGNLALDGESSKTEAVLKKLFFLNTAIYGYLCVGTLFLIEEFITEIWFTKDFALPAGLACLITIELFLRSIHYPVHCTRNAMGAFSEHKIIFAGSAFLNIVLDFILIKPLGMNGLYIATIFCRCLTYLIDAWVVYHIKFEKSLLGYLWMVLKWCIFLLGCSGVIYYALTYVSQTGIIGFLLKILVITIVYGISFLVVFFKSEEFKYYIALTKKMIKKKIR